MQTQSELKIAHLETLMYSPMLPYRFINDLHYKSSEMTHIALPATQTHSISRDEVC